MEAGGTSKVMLKCRKFDFFKNLNNFAFVSPPCDGVYLSLSSL